MISQQYASALVAISVVMREKGGADFLSGLNINKYNESVNARISHTDSSA